MTLNVKVNRKRVHILLIKNIIQIHIVSQLVGTPKLHVACRAWLIVHAVMHQFFSFFHVRCQKVTELQYHSPCLHDAFIYGVILYTNQD
jgi:hypothetical protein